uniref:Uncharacterized protein n=1 Tax=Timema tahoe TaxID=61484 RepID=A0A7R9IBV8_9NEOP|nr:unnamed protein product [Timema tahoe]
MYPVSISLVVSYIIMRLVLVPSLLGALFPLPRVIYAMSSDGLVFRSLGNVHPRFQTPVVGTILAGLLTGTFVVINKGKGGGALMSTLCYMGGGRI